MTADAGARAMPYSEGISMARTKPHVPVLSLVALAVALLAVITPAGAKPGGEAELVLDMTRSAGPP
ncbi:hypothetical protein [Sphaerisporangium fuscum]|uniref:hypothetical protein n=1 Tax=Sphaerisporangium fuscum TaxID=2835868 RepID=UPI001BDC456F|nr:hypothetical protein [Sphaerisporangium fuscum]